MKNTKSTEEEDTITDLLLISYYEEDDYQLCKKKLLSTYKESDSVFGESMRYPAESLCLGQVRCLLDLEGAKLLWLNSDVISFIINFT